MDLHKAPSKLQTGGLRFVAAFWTNLQVAVICCSFLWESADPQGNSTLVWILAGIRVETRFVIWIKLPISLVQIK